MKFFFSIVFIFSFFFNSFSQKINENLDLTQFYSGELFNYNIATSSKAKIDSIYNWYLANYNITDQDEVYKEFVYRYNFFLEKLNKSGKVFNNNEITIYLNALKDKILEKREEKNRIQVYLVDFDQLNAFTNDFGGIYVNVGTIARLENEKELILVLAHEIAHILSRHSFKMENLNERLTNKGKFSEINEINAAEYHKFSRKQEMEADSLAYILLKEANISLDNLGALFEKLKYCNNPVYNTTVDILNCFGGNPIINDHLTRVKSDIGNISFSTNGHTVDSLTTHPSVEQRIDFYNQVILEKSDSIVYEGIAESYDHYKKLASFVLIRTLMSNQKYVESLYLICQLMEQYPKSDYLITNKLKNLLLLDQEKYLTNSFNVVNDYMGSCSDQDFLRFKYLFLRSSALDLNVLTIENIKQAQKMNEIPYHNRLLDFSYQFLYKYNTYLISSKNNQLILNPEEGKMGKYYFDPISMYTKDQRKEAVKLKEDGFFLAEHAYKDSVLLVSFAHNFQDLETFNLSTEKYKARRDSYESMLTLDQFDFETDIDRAYKKSKKGTFVFNKPISDNATVAVIQSDTYYFDLKNSSITLDYHKTLETEELINLLLEEEHLYTVKLTNNNSKNVSVSENYLHSLLSDWIDETMLFSDLVYSVADEEIMNNQTINKIDYIVYNLNLIQKKSNRYRSVYYELYFDISNMGIVYVSKITSKRKPKQTYLRHYFYQSYHRKLK